MLCKLVRKLIPAADTVPVGKISVVIVKSLCNVIFIAKSLIIAGEYHLVVYPHLFGKDFLRQIGKSYVMKVRIRIGRGTGKFVFGSYYKSLDFFFNIKSHNVNGELITHMYSPCLRKFAEQPESLLIVGVKILALCGKGNGNVCVLLEIAVHLGGIVFFVRFSEDLGTQLNFIYSVYIGYLFKLLLSEICTVYPAVRKYGIVLKSLSCLFSADNICLKSRIAPHGYERQKHYREKLCKVRLNVP